MRKQYTNPFMPSPAQLELKRAIRDYKIWFHLLEYGESVGDGFYSINKMACAVRPVLTGEDAEKLDEGIRIFDEATRYNAWRKSYTRPVDEAMDVILKRFPKLPQKVAFNAVKQALA